MPEGIWFAFNCFNSECIAGSHQFIHLMSHIRLSLELLVIQGKHLSKLKPGLDALFFYFIVDDFWFWEIYSKDVKKKNKSHILWPWKHWQPETWRLWSAGIYLFKGKYPSHFQSFTLEFISCFMTEKIWKIILFQIHFNDFHC